MSVNLSGGLTGLSLLAGSSAFGATSEIKVESKAVRTAKAQFTLTPSTPPWKEATATGTASARLTAILAGKTVIDVARGSDGTILPPDVQTSFTTYKALDKLRVLAGAAAAATASDALRAQYQKAFGKGLSQLQTYLASAPSDLVNIAFGRPSSTATSSKLAAATAYETEGKGLVAKRSDPIPGLTGQEQFSIRLAVGTRAETFTVDLAQGSQPPTIDSVIGQFNAAIAATPALHPDGSPVVDAKGDPVTRWSARFTTEYRDGKWTIDLKTPDGLEQVTIDQRDAKDSIVVATGQTALDAPTATTVFRLDDPAGAASRVAMGTIAALDRDATARNALAGRTTSVTTTKLDMDGKVVKSTTKTSDAHAPTDAAAIAVDALGNSYVVGTTKGDLGANLSDGDEGLFLTKMDGAGKVVWQRALGATGTSTGAAVAIAADGSVVVAGTVTGSFNGATSADADMVVARFAANGDEKFSTVIRATGADAARAVVVGADGAVFVGGRSGANGGDAFIARIDSAGRIAERRSIGGSGSDTVSALAIGADGNLLAVVAQDGVASVRKLEAADLANDLGRVDLGAADVRAIAVAADGTIAVGGAASGAVTGAQGNARGDGRDGFVARIDAALSGAGVTYLATTGDDQVDSIAFVGGDLYAGGRTTGNLGAPRRGPTDGFVARIDAGTGTILNTTQFGQSLLRTEPVRIAADPGGGNAISALGFGRGTINAAPSERVTTQTTLRAGDHFSIRADGGTVRKVTIEAGDTLKTIATRVQGMLGASKGSVTATAVDGEQQLRITMKSGHELELIAGTGGTDALAKLGIEPQRIATQATLASSAPRVRPGGTFGLDLSDTLSLATKDDAKVAARKIDDALSMSQSAYRSLFWDDAKALIVDGVQKKGAGTQSTVRETAMLKNYQAALTRLSSTGNSMIGFK